MLIDGLVAYLLTQTSITSVVGTRIQPIPATEDFATNPGITIQGASDVSEDANDGPVGVAEARIIFDCLAPRYLVARNLALALKSVLNCYSGTLPDGTVVQHVKSANVVDRFDDGSRVSCTSYHALITYGD
jgi:hypothetical protein